MKKQMSSKLKSRARKLLTSKKSTLPMSRRLSSSAKNKMKLKARVKVMKTRNSRMKRQDSIKSRMV